MILMTMEMMIMTLADKDTMFLERVRTIGGKSLNNHYIMFSMYL